jgi:hypothetical protein
VGDRFRSMIESELAEVEPPPIGNLVDNAIRDGQRLRRTRLVQRGVACAAAVGALVLGLGMASATLRTEGVPDRAGGPGGGVAAAPPSPWPSAPASRTTGVPAGTPPMAIYQATAPVVVEAKPSAAPPAVVLAALDELLPPGRTVGHAGGVFDAFTGVQVFLDRGDGFGMVRVAVAYYPAKPAPSCDSPPGVVVRCAEEDGAVVETFEIESNCVQRRGVNVYRTDGLVIQVNVGSCLVDGQWKAPPTDSVDEQVLAVDEAVKIGLNPIWRERAMTDAAAKAGQRYPDLPILTAFDGVGG